MSRRPVTAVAVVLSAAVLSACGTGLQAQTYRESGRQDGTNTTLDGVAVRNLYVAPPASGSTIAVADKAVLLGVLVNQGTTSDALVSASTDAAGSATLQENGQPATSIAAPAGGTSTTPWSIVLSGLTAPLQAGRYISVTLVFDKAGRTTVRVPILAGDNGLADRKAAQNPYGEGNV